MNGAWLKKRSEDPFTFHYICDLTNDWVQVVCVMKSNSVDPKRWNITLRQMMSGLVLSESSGLKP